MRFEDWPERLAQFIEARRHQPFVRGTHDCVMFAADAIQAMTGVDLAAEYRGSYTTTKEALRFIQGRGGMENIVPLESIPVALAGRGDIAMIDTPEGDALAVHLGRTIAAQGGQGILFLPVSAAKRAWKGDTHG
ncbi:MAG TPA: hypothetical protein VJ654_03060 [Noviherbaspirillum sp.]|nr:hypothetical protein [Noviherbaspirillum sp.]